MLPQLLLLLAVSVGLAEQARLVDSMEDPGLYTPAQPELGHKWTGTVALETADFKEGKGCLRFDINSAKIADESYPQWGRSLDPAKNDWRAYQALRYWVKVVSQDKSVPFKNMCVVVYNGDSPLQQFVTHQVPVNKWVQLTDVIMDYNRDRVRGIIIYLYETNPTWQDNYTWYVDGIELLPSPEGAVSFDGIALATKPEPTRPAKYTVHNRRLALQMDDRGRIGGFSCDGRSLYRAGKEAPPYTGLLIRDWRRGEEIVPVGGTLKASQTGVTQQAEVLQGLKVSATLEPVVPDGKAASQGVGTKPTGTPPSAWLACHVTVRDTKPEDRPLTLYFALPVEAKGWDWWDDIKTSRRIEGMSDFISNPSSLRAPRVSPYPYCCLNDDKSGIGFATSLDVPRLQRMAYNPSLGVLYMAYNFCLTPAATKQKQTADFTFYIAPVNPAWGFRAMVADYYQAFPSFFIKRVPKEGGWGCWGYYGANPRIAELGYQFHWGPDPRGGKDFADSVRWDNEHGYYSLPYIEWTNMHVSMEMYETAGNEEIMKQVRYIADPNRKEPLPRYQYVFPYDERMGPDYDNSMRRVFQGYLKSLIFSPQGLLYGGANKSEFSLLVAKYIPFNADPDIPGGAGAFFLNEYWPMLEKYYADRGAKPDGFGWDNFYVSGTALDYRREHFAYADYPLTFDTRSLAPALMKDMCTYELQQATVAKLRSMGRYLIANQGLVSPVSATLPLLDVFGYEWGVGDAAIYARTLAHHKPICSLPVTGEHWREPFVREHLLYGNWPGGYSDVSSEEYIGLMHKYLPIIRRLTQAGWEPVTLVRCDDPQVQVERFGGEAGKPLLLSIRNNAGADRPVRLKLEAPLQAPAEVTELVDGAACSMTGGEIELTAPAGKVIVLALR